MCLNFTKFNMMIFSRTDYLTVCNYTINNTYLTRVPLTVDVGVYFGPK